MWNETMKLRAYLFIEIFTLWLTVNVVVKDNKIQRNQIERKRIVNGYLCEAVAFSLFVLYD